MEMFHLLVMKIGRVYITFLHFTIDFSCFKLYSLFVRIFRKKSILKAISMLIQFAVGNYRSIKDTETFSMLAATIVSEDKTLDETNVFEVNDKLKLLKSAAIYGANASGKSNFIAALDFMKKFVLASSREGQITDLIPVSAFRLSTETEHEPSFFEMIFMLDGQQYTYGFEVTSEKVVAEWLSYMPNNRKAILFERNGQTFKISDRFKEGKDLEKRTRPNALFLSVVAQFNGTLSNKILLWFVSLGIIPASIDMKLSPLMLIALRRVENKDRKNDMLNFIKKLDIGIEDIQTRKSPFIPPPELKGVMEELNKLSRQASEERTEVLTTHRKYNAEQEFVGNELFTLDNHESEGTQKLFALSAPLLDTLKNGEILIVDELDARLHPLITCAIIALFNSNETNPKNAQLIFATHDTNLLNKELFRRDQIWFTEKDRFGATHLFSLVEFKVRNDASFEKNYINGKYGAIPFIGDIKYLFEGNNE